MMRGRSYRQDIILQVEVTWEEDKKENEYAIGVTVIAHAQTTIMLHLCLTTVSDVKREERREVILHRESQVEDRPELDTTSLVLILAMVVSLVVAVTREETESEAFEGLFRRSKTVSILEGRLGRGEGGRESNVGQESRVLVVVTVIVEIAVAGVCGNLALRLLRRR